MRRCEELVLLLVIEYPNLLPFKFFLFPPSLDAGSVLKCSEGDRLIVEGKCTDTA